MLTRSQMEKFRDISVAWSPENLTCDGELSDTEVSERLDTLRSEWNKLELEVGRPVKENEVWANVYWD